MKLTNAPGKIVLPFANAGAKNSIPVNSLIGITPGAASMVDGFPPLTRTPIAAGGVPPSGLDMNGILYELSAIVRWAAAGGGYPYDADFSTDANVAGYPKGARVLRSDGAGYWYNTTDDNTTDPEAAGAAAAGWVPDFTSGVAAVVMDSANVTLTPLQYGKPIIAITGALTADLNLVFPDIAGKWHVINATTGAYKITCKTSDDAGVIAEQGFVTEVISDGLDLRSNLDVFKASSGAGIIGWIASGIGAVKRWILDKLRDFPTPEDFGAVGNDVADDTAAFQACADANDSFDLVKGKTYLITAPITLTHRHQIRFRGAKIHYTGAGHCFDIYTDAADLDFTVCPVIENPIILGSAAGDGAIRINSVWAPKIVNPVASGFSNGCTITLRNVAIGGNARWNEGYNITGLTSNYNKGGVRMHVDGGTTSFGYGHIQGQITPRTGTAGNRSYGLLVETTQLYNTSLNLSIWCNGYADGLVVGSATAAGRLYWCNLYLRGEAFGTNNYSIDLTYGDIIGCTGALVANMGQVNNPSNKLLQLYGTFQRTNYGYSSLAYNGGILGKLIPLMASWQVEDYPAGKPEAGFGIVNGTDLVSAAAWFYDAANNGFGIFKAPFDGEPDTTNPLLFVDVNGKTKTKAVYSYATTFSAAGSTTTTQVYDVGAILDTTGAYLITAHCFGADTNLAVTGLILYSAGSGDVICPVVTLGTQDYNFGSIALQTYANAAVNTFNAGNGRKFQVVVTNGNATAMSVNVTITRLGV